MFAKFEVYQAMVETKIGKKLKTFQFDNGGEFTVKDFSNLREVHNITMQLANSYTPWW
jgi:IS30 family transposase